jgi:aminoglycoside phosphotransferase (APT) family kinase protein
MRIRKLLDATTICQGDAWSNNVMISTGADGSVTDQIAAIIDWQLLFEASPMLDLARFIAIGADAEIRRECEGKAVDLLYRTFCDESTKLGNKVEYTREQAHELYDYALIHQVGSLF